MMKRALILILIIFFLGGAYFAFSKMGDQNHNGHNMDKPETQSHRSYEIEVTQKPNPDQVALNKPVRIKYKIKNDKGETLKDFAVVHEKIMHFILIRKDLMQFQHLHPSFDKNSGEFSVDVTFTVDGPYRFFADFTPVDENPMKLPVARSSDINVGDVSGFQPHEVAVSTNKNIAVGPLDENYMITYDIPNDLKSQTSATYNLTVGKDSNPVKLEKYLGALGHSVILKKGTLDYIHTHAGEQSDQGNHAQMGHDVPDNQNSNKVEFSTTFPEPGIYKIFTQFQHEKKVLTTDYTVEVK